MCVCVAVLDARALRACAARVLFFHRFGSSSFSYFDPPHRRRPSLSSSSSSYRRDPAARRRPYQCPAVAVSHTHTHTQTPISTLRTPLSPLPTAAAATDPISLERTSGARDLLRAPTTKSTRPPFTFREPVSRQPLLLLFGRPCLESARFRDRMTEPRSTVMVGRRHRRTGVTPCQAVSLFPGEKKLKMKIELKTSLPPPTELSSH